MKYIQAIIAFGLFGFLGIAVLADKFAASGGGSGRTRALNDAVTFFTQTYGQTETGFGIILFGLTVGWMILLKGNGRAA